MVEVKLTYQQRKAVAKEIKGVILPLQQSKESFERLIDIMDGLPENPTDEQCDVFAQTFLDSIRSSLAVDTAFKNVMNKLALLSIDNRN